MTDGEKMLKQQAEGDALAKQCLDFYRLHRACTSDPGARGLFNAAYAEWKKREEVQSRA